MPEADSLDELNALIRRWDARDDLRRISGRRMKVEDDYATERPLLEPLPVERFDPGLVLPPRVSKSSLIVVWQAKYSVLVHLIDQQCGYRCARRKWLCSTGAS